MKSFPSMPTINRQTIFSPCRLYRYTLWREWDAALPYVQFVGLNPSTADEVNDDPTIGRCIQFAKDWGYGALCMTNIFAWRDTDPQRMRRAREPIGADNDRWLVEIAKGAGIVLAAWGNHGNHLYRSTKVKWLLPKLHCLAVTKKGQPVHPLYQPSNLKPIAYERT